MLVYAKFVKDQLTRKSKLNYDENIALTEECSAIIQMKLPLNQLDTTFHVVET